MKLFICLNLLLAFSLNSMEMEYPKIIYYKSCANVPWETSFNGILKTATGDIECQVSCNTEIDMYYYGHIKGTRFTLPPTIAERYYKQLKSSHVQKNASAADSSVQ